MSYVVIGVLIVVLFVFLMPLQRIKKHGRANVFLFRVMTKLKSDYPIYETVIENDGRIKCRFNSPGYSFTVDFIYMRNKIQLTVQGETNKFHVCETLPYDAEEIEISLLVILRTMEINRLIQ
jgi:hypothetical protein